ncbi:hypothetical protein NP233_g2190 [Leucocoprinus birnbaumii]|uniref:F-box domain-containing protein n=1 Tax=Leucocoprinus birnbaumii TaxID=56174 RepID=A0AAD5YV45_9AGAR|nr:hypothetical protein NP233_g2190 [Leucocoprinus birnbaumii]
MSKTRNEAINESPASRDKGIVFSLNLLTVNRERDPCNFSGSGFKSADPEKDNMQSANPLSQERLNDRAIVIKTLSRWRYVGKNIIPRKASVLRRNRGNNANTSFSISITWGSNAPGLSVADVISGVNFNNRPILATNYLMDLPAEILAQIFDLAADDDLILQYGIQTSFSVYAWHKAFHGGWQLRSSREALNYIQKRSYFTKKSIISTCRKWRGVGRENLFRYLFFDHPNKLLALCRVLRSDSAVSTTISSSLGWWTRRIHLANRDYRGRVTMSDLQNALVLVMKHCPNLEIFIVDSPMGSTFGPVADALGYHAARSLRTVHWQVPSDADALAKVIWALDSLPYLVAAHIHFTSIASEDDDDARSDFGSVRLGSASNLQLNLRYLQQLSLQGQFQEFLEQAKYWSLKALQSLAFDYGNRREELPDVITFLQRHGSTLRYLDINCIPLLDVSKILDVCPNLHTFAFNPDWRIIPNDGVSSELVRVPHFNITSIGLHGLYYAFGVGHGAAHAQGAPITAQIIRKSNDMNVAALNKLNFPKLECVRILSSVVLKDLERENGPSGDGVQRYDNWWNTLSRAGIRLEDCTGAPLGTLPQDEDEEDGTAESEDETGEEATNSESISDSETETDTDDAAYQSAEETFTRGDEDEEEEEEEEEVENILDPGKKHVTELRRLLEECRIMEQTREELPYTSMMMRPPGASAHSGETDYGVIYQQLTGSNNAPAPTTPPPQPTSPISDDQLTPEASFGFGSRNHGRRPRVSFGISDEPPILDDSPPLSRSGTSSRRSSGRGAPQSRRSSSQFIPQSRRTSSHLGYAPSESDLGTLLGVPEDSPAISSTATLVADDDSDDGYRYQYDDDDDDDYDDDDYEDEEDESDEQEDEDRNPVATLRKLLEECRAMRQEAEEPMLNPMMFGGPMAMSMGMGMGPYGIGMGYPTAGFQAGYGGRTSYPTAAPRNTTSCRSALPVGPYSSDADHDLLLLFNSSHNHAMNRGPIILTIDEAEYLVDQLPPPSAEDDEMVKKLRKRLQDLLSELRAGAEGTIKS